MYLYSQMTLKSCLCVFPLKADGCVGCWQVGELCCMCVFVRNVYTHVLKTFIYCMQKSFINFFTLLTKDTLFLFPSLTLRQAVISIKYTQHNKYNELLTLAYHQDKTHFILSCSLVLF